MMILKVETASGKVQYRPTNGLHTLEDARDLILSGWAQDAVYATEYATTQPAIIGGLVTIDCDGNRWSIVRYTGQDITPVSEYGNLHN